MIANDLQRFFSNMEDPRAERNQKHPFLSLICIGLLGVLAGIDSFSGLADYVESYEEQLKDFIELPAGAPSHDTLQRFFSNINYEQFNMCFMEFTNYLAVKTKEFIAIDGKTIRNSSSNQLHIVSAWCDANSMVLGQIKVAEKSNEIKAIPKLLGLLDLTHKIITIDAMGCQRAIATQIIANEGDYIFGLKANQKTLETDVIKAFQDLDNLHISMWEEHDVGHGRKEERYTYVTDNIEELQAKHKWPGLQTIALVRSKRTIKGVTTEEKRYYISSLPANAEKICQAARKHWGIENKLHWRLDVVFNEDKACIRNEHAAENMNIMRKWALNILNAQKGKSSLKSMQRKASMSWEYMVQILNKAFHA